MATSKTELLEAKVGRQNRVVLPAKVRRRLAIQEGDYVAFELTDERITLVALELRKKANKAIST